MIDENHIDTVDVSRPVVLAEIRPTIFSLIDGNHRAVKAQRLGMTTIKARRLTVEKHIRFLTSEDSYLTYVEYWNGKVKELKKIGDGNNSRYINDGRGIVYS